jgi:hypothetical protein
MVDPFDKIRSPGFYVQTHICTATPEKKAPRLGEGSYSQGRKLFTVEKPDSKAFPEHGL